MDELADCDIDERRDVVLRVFVRHDTISLSPVSVVLVLLDVVVVRDLCFQYSDGVCIPLVDPAVRVHGCVEVESEGVEGFAESPKKGHE